MDVTFLDPRLGFQPTLVPFSCVFSQSRITVLVVSDALSVVKPNVLQKIEKIKNDDSTIRQKDVALLDFGPALFQLDLSQVLSGQLQFRPNFVIVLATTSSKLEGLYDWLDPIIPFWAFKRHLKTSTLLIDQDGRVFTIEGFAATTSA